MRKDLNKLQTIYPKMKIIILMTLFVLTCLPFVVGAEQFLGTFKQHDCVNLLQTCSNCTYSNISSVSYPDSSQAMGEQEMTKVGTIYNKTLCSTSIVGTYLVNGYADLDGEKTVWSYTFIVTPSGGPESNTIIFIIFILVSLGLLIFAFLTQNQIFALLSGFAFLGTGMYAMIYGFGDVTSLYTRILAYILLGFGAILTILSSLDFLREHQRVGSYEE